MELGFDSQIFARSFCQLCQALSHEVAALTKGCESFSGQTKPRSGQWRGHMTHLITRRALSECVVVMTLFEAQREKSFKHITPSRL